MNAQSQKIIVVDPDLCTGCEVCETACGFSHEGVFNSPNSRIKRIRIEPSINSALNCQFCAEPPCVAVCPQKCMEKDEKLGIIRVNGTKCDGCGFCMRACPFGAITLHSRTKKAILCDLCESVEEKQPQCALFCPKEAIKVFSLNSFSQEARRTQLLALVKVLKVEPAQGGD
nr:4Fe-4S dicluster domain-containing protein [Candidatus Sigynarchaeota archaeon]